MGKLHVVVLYDRWEEPEQADAPPRDKAPLTRTLDKKEVEDEVAETLGKLGHEATLHVLDGSTKSLHALARMDCDLVFNLAESFGGNDTADYCIAAYLELLDKRITGAGSRGLLYGQDKAVAKKILEFHGIHTPVFARSFRGRLDFSHDLEFPVIVKPAREDGSIGIEFNAVVSSIRELMERIDWLHANFDSPVLIEEYVEGPRNVRRRHRQRQSDRASGDRARSVEAARRPAAHRRGRSEVGQRAPAPIATRSRRWPKIFRRRPLRSSSRPPSPCFRRWSFATTRASTCAFGRTAASP